MIARWVAMALFVLAVPVFLVLSNVRVAAMEPRVYEYSFNQYDAVGRSGVDRAQLDRAAREIVAYFGNDEPLLTTRVTIDRVEQALFNPREVEHMRDVKALFRVVFRVQEVAFVYVVGYVAAVFLWSRERSMRQLARQSIAAGIATAGLLAMAAGAVVVGFDDLFEQFHLLSFSNDFWQLNPRTDHLIQMFPQGFWFDVTLGVGAITIAQGAVLAAIGYGYLLWLDYRAGRGDEGPPALLPADAEGAS
ncbi:MAG: TIGR01906 family membrane protein [Dehalococcoidia bacterium]|jgi:integral membrane protein (TIGR01906 family)|nr:TIGR01906 family membrane protein [Dehalococcoidia bacterium]